MPVAVITGASRGLGLALARALAGEGWSLVLDARDGTALQASAPTGAVVVPGDVTQAGHRAQLRRCAAELGGLDLLVNNASYLGPSPQPHIADYPERELRRVYEVGVFAPLALIRELLSLMRKGTILNITSNAAREPYEGWGGYGSAKAALEQATAVLAVEHPDLRVQALDPGDLRTQLQQEAFPGQDISDRPLPETVVPAILQLLGLPSGRYRAADLLTESAR